MQIILTAQNPLEAEAPFLRVYLIFPRLFAYTCLHPHRRFDPRQKGAPRHGSRLNRAHRPEKKTLPGKCFWKGNDSLLTFGDFPPDHGLGLAVGAAVEPHCRSDDDGFILRFDAPRRRRCQRIRRTLKRIRYTAAERFINGPRGGVVTERTGVAPRDSLRPAVERVSIVMSRQPCSRVGLRHFADNFPILCRPVDSFVLSKTRQRRPSEQKFCVKRQPLTGRF